jgi:hypothetical protein
VSLLSGIVGPLIAKWSIQQKHARLQQYVEERFHELSDHAKVLDARLQQFEHSANLPSGETEGVGTDQHRPPRSKPSWPTTDSQQRRGLSRTRVDGNDPPLIAVPNLAAAANDRDVAVNGLTQRYAAIWSLAASGSSAEVIARATGQPVGQIELILGLRRQIDGTRTTISHAPHS